MYFQYKEDKARTMAKLVSFLLVKLWSFDIFNIDFKISFMKLVIQKKKKELRFCATTFNRENLQTLGNTCT